MTVIELLEKLGSIEAKPELVTPIYRIFAYEYTDTVHTYDKEAVKAILQKCSIEALGSYAVKLGKCLSEAQEEQESLAPVADTSYAKNVNKVANEIKGILSLYYEVANERTSKQNNTESTLSQHNEYLEEVKVKLKDLKTDVENANRLIDDKVFTLLINTVAILGIFVAIAFSGFGVISIFSNLDFAQAFSSKANLIKSVFFLLLTAVFSYNLLLLLVYFIYRLSRPLIIRMSADDDKHDSQDKFSKLMNLTPFIRVDCILSALTVAFFIWCQFI